MLYYKQTKIFDIRREIYDSDTDLTSVELSSHPTLQEAHKAFKEMYEIDKMIYTKYKDENPMLLHDCSPLNSYSYSFTIGNITLTVYIDSLGSVGKSIFNRHNNKI